jgi:hypothetical protein
MGVSSQLHAVVALPTRKQPLVPTKCKAGWASEPVWMLGRREKSPTPAGNENIIFQPSSLFTVLNKVSWNIKDYYRCFEWMCCNFSMGLEHTYNPEGGDV